MKYVFIVKKNTYIKMSAEMKTLDNHKWFAAKFKQAVETHLKEVEKEKELNKIYRNLIIFAIIFSLGSFILSGKILLFILRISLLNIYVCILVDKMDNLNEPTVYMRFTRKGIFYKNTHYFFAGTKQNLEKFIAKERASIESAKKEKGFGCGDHDNLWDTPLDTFCDKYCDCEEYPLMEDYKCSHWELYCYETKEKLLLDMNKLKQGIIKSTNMFPNEIICIQND